MSDNISIKTEKSKTDPLLSNSYSPNQQTLKGPVTLQGVGLHTGEKVTMTIKPANPGYGIRFMRVDLPDRPIVKACRADQPS